MCIGMYFVFKLFDFQLDTTRTVSIIILTIITAGYGLLSYWLGSKVFRVKEISIVEMCIRDRAYLKAAKKILEDEGLTDIDIYHEISLELNNISDGRELTGDSSKEPESIEIPEYSEEDQIDLGLKELQKDNSYILE